MTCKILWIDDEPYAMQDWADILEEEGFTLVRCRTTEEAVRHYNNDFYDLFILDRMMHAGEIFEERVNYTAAKTGWKVYQDIRHRRHIKSVPIIIFTQYFDPEEAEDITRQDERVVVLRKNVLPTQLLVEARAMIQKFPLVSLPVPQVSDFEHPNAVPYYATEAATGKRVRLFFEHCETGEGSYLQSSNAASDWQYKARYTEYLSDPINSRFVLKLLRHENPDSDPAGLYFTGGFSGQKEWYRKVLFEVAPWNRANAPQRQLRGVGKVMVARFLRECLYRAGHLEENIIVNIERFEEQETLLHPKETGKEYLIRLGFRADKSEPKLLSIGHEAARKLIEEVSNRILESNKSS